MPWPGRHPQCLQKQQGLRQHRQVSAWWKHPLPCPRLRNRPPTKCSLQPGHALWQPQPQAWLQSKCPVKHIYAVETATLGWPGVVTRLLSASGSSPRPPAWPGRGCSELLCSASPRPLRVPGLFDCRTAGRCLHALAAPGQGQAATGSVSDWRPASSARRLSHGGGLAKVPLPSGDRARASPGSGLDPSLVRGAYEGR